ncbi:arginine--tRNA ligase [Agarilytica rhodophyticola]|uniref:arginine--tRNA ligase n=1 Tax=Agarilytica rhodophyticola TaxID=1737490 RepID=UPI000B346EA6|nr:arginine--tRNA ligase [Agarilytica rhodophyticola]
MNIRNLIAEHIKSAMKAAGVPSKFQAHVAPSKNPKFGDYQANGAMAAAKGLKMNPRDLAQKIVDHLTLDDIASKIEIAGPGFINIHLDHSWLAHHIANISNDDRLNIAKKTAPQTVVVDYSAPNLAKEMHVGHLRSTIIGDAIVRVLEFLGDQVIRQNHVGDWGTQFGMLIAELELHMSEGEQAELALKDLESFYKQAKSHFDSDEAFANTAREYVVKLQSGDAKILKLWQQFRSISLSHNQEIYQTLNVTLNNDHVCGESFYNDDLPVLVEELKEQKLAQEDQGAQVVKLAELANKEGEPSVVIIQKNDGGYLYSTTDLAAIRYRVNHLKAQRILYFIDDRQSLHLKQVYTLARKAQFVPKETSLEHHAFGKMLGKDKTPFKTRAGGTVKLADLLQEAVERASNVIQGRENFSEQEMQTIANNVGIGAVKYADLSKTRTTDYVFDWESMLSFEGNTGPYMQYAYARVCSVFDKAEIDMDKHISTITIDAPQEKDLAIKIMRLPEIIEQVADDAYPHTLCSHLYELASAFMTFYEACPILKSDVSAEQKASRLQLSKACAKSLKLGLNLLGINVMRKM